MRTQASHRTNQRVTGGRRRQPFSSSKQWAFCARCREFDDSNKAPLHCTAMLPSTDNRQGRHRNIRGHQRGTRSHAQRPYSSSEQWAVSVRWRERDESDDGNKAPIESRSRTTARVSTGRSEANSTRRQLTPLGRAHWRNQRSGQLSFDRPQMFSKDHRGGRISV